MTVETIGALLLIGAGLALWLAPIFIASARRHPQIGPIVVVDILLGWTGIGWIIALAWSLSSTTQKATTP